MGFSEIFSHLPKVLVSTLQSCYGNVIFILGHSRKAGHSVSTIVAYQFSRTVSLQSTFYLDVAGKCPHNAYITITCTVIVFVFSCSNSNPFKVGRVHSVCGIAPGCLHNICHHGPVLYLRQSSGD